MALTKLRNTNKIYPDKELWEKYMSWGKAASHLKLRRWLIENGFSIKEYGMGAFWAMWRYAIRNPEEAFPLYKKWYFETASDVKPNPDVIDPVVTFQDFLEDCRLHARQRSCVSRGEYIRFCNKHGLQSAP
jgi:hypothetical protein